MLACESGVRIVAYAAVDVVTEARIGVHGWVGLGRVCPFPAWSVTALAARPNRECRAFWPFLAAILARSEGFSALTGMVNGFVSLLICPLTAFSALPLVLSGRVRLGRQVVGIPAFI